MWFRKKLTGEEEDPLKAPLYEYEETHTTRTTEREVITKKVHVKRRVNLRFVKLMVDRVIIVSVLWVAPSLVTTVITILGVLG